MFRFLKITVNYYNILERQCNSNHTETIYIYIYMVNRLSRFCHIQEKHFASINYWMVCDRNSLVWRKSFGHETQRILL